LTDPSSIARGLKLCREIAGRANANFLHAARLLPRRRQDFFFATYAAMRVIDDLVDDDFLTLPPDDRAQGRAAMHRVVADWVRQTTEISPVPGAGPGPATAPLAGPLDADIVAALAATAGRSDLGVWPWHALADALSSDVEEREMRSWEDFLRYCAGATVAPASIFIYLLAVRHDADTGYGYELPHPARYYAADLGVYCYIVHILRDLAKDASRSPRLITIPTEMLGKIGLSRESLAGALADKSSTIADLAALLIAEAEPFRKAGHNALRDVCGHLGRVEAMALKGLIAIYDRLYERASRDALAVALNGPAMEEGLRRELLHGTADD
jgi:phytoene synthase